MAVFCTVNRPQALLQTGPCGGCLAMLRRTGVSLCIELGLANVVQTAFSCMIDLVHFIAESSYARNLFPYTSHADLHIGRVSHFASGDGELMIVYDQQAKTFRFTYQQRADDVKPWSTECGAEDGRRKFEQILHKRLRWFHEG